MAPIMIDDDSDDDLPLMARPKPAAGGSAGKREPRDSSSSEEPEWMKTFKSPVKQIVDDLSSDDDDLDFHAAITGRAGPKFEMGSTPAKMVKSPPAGAKDDDDDEVDDDEVDDDDGPNAADDDDDDEVEVTHTEDAPKAATPKPAPPPTAPSTTAATAPGVPTPNRPGELPLLMPAAVNRNKVLFELEGAGEAVDLEGDVGVVGRLLSESNSMQMDLKGVVYNARVLPTPASIVILAVNQTEAKVESVANDFVQLREDPNANTAGVGGTLDGYLGVDSDDEDHHVGRVAAGGAASAAVRAMDDVSDDEAGGKRKRGAGGGGAKARKLGADGKSKAGKKPAKRPKKKPAKRPKKR